MDDLREIIQTLNDDDKREFRYFLNRVKQKKDRKDVALFDLLGQEEFHKKEEIKGKLYGSGGVDAYYALRKRLNKQITDFVILKSREKDTTAISTVIDYINLSQYLYDNKKRRLSFKFLKKARSLAEEIEHHELLNAIYNLMIDKNEWNTESELQEIIKSYKLNKDKLEQEEKIGIANSFIRQKLTAFQFDDHSMDFEELISSIFSDLGLDMNLLSNPRILHKVMSISRKAIVAKKDYRTFESFVTKRYAHVLSLNLFTDKTVYYKMGLLYFISHTLYRNKKFDESRKYLNELKKCLDGEGNSYYIFYYPKYMQLLAGILVFTKDLSGALQCLDKLLDNKRLNLQIAERLNITLSKGIYYHLAGEFELSNKMLLSIYHTDKYCEKIMGKEWVLKKNLMEVMLYFDMDKIEVAESRLRSIERTFKSLFKEEMYHRVKSFLSLIKYVVLNPIEARSEEFHSRVEKTIVWQSFEEEDLQAMGFYAWLKAKMFDRSVYEVWTSLVEEVEA